MLPVEYTQLQYDSNLCSCYQLHFHLYIENQLLCIVLNEKTVKDL